MTDDETGADDGPPEDRSSGGDGDDGVDDVDGDGGVDDVDSSDGIDGTDGENGDAGDADDGHDIDVGDVHTAGPDASGASADTGTDPGASPHSSARTRDRADDPEALREEIERLRDRVDEFEDSVESRTVQRDSLEGDLRRYVRRKIRRGHARDWGPYVVLLYGTVLALGAFYYLDGIWAILAMFVVWTSTLGVYVLMVLFGAGLSAAQAPRRLLDAIGDRRS